MPSFRKDLAFGEEAQKRFCDFLVRKGLSIDKVANGYFKEWDIKLENGVTFEIKADKASESTGNFFFEFSYKEKLSGFLGTSADYFVVISKNFAWIAKKIDVVTFFFTHPCKSRVIKRAGDNGNTRGVVIKVEDYKPNNLKVEEL